MVRQVLHEDVCRDGEKIAEAELGVDVINVGPEADIAAVRSAMTGRCCFSGNLDPIEVLMRGTARDVTSETKRIIETCAPAGGYLFCTGEMNLRDVPVENVRAMVEAVENTKV